VPTGWRPARLFTVNEIAKAGVFVASDDSSYITDAKLFVDGRLRTSLGQSLRTSRHPR
jgi:NAD(P)-dependent dehydrogenase (short-subunit alcohol dehydrogenase family)